MASGVRAEEEKSFSLVVRRIRGGGEGSAALTQKNDSAKNKRVQPRNLDGHKIFRKWRRRKTLTIGTRNVQEIRTIYYTTIQKELLSEVEKLDGDIMVLRGTKTKNKRKKY